MGSNSLGSCLSYEETISGEHYATMFSDEICYPKWDWQQTSDFSMLSEDFSSSIDCYIPSIIFQYDFDFPNKIVEEMESIEWNNCVELDDIHIQKGDDIHIQKGDDIHIQKGEDGGELKWKEEDKVLVEKEEKYRNRVVVRGREERVLTFEEVSSYFYMPITQAAKELNVGLTLLKKKCRELGIPRWPHRKMKSLQTLIRNVQEMGRDGRGRDGEEQLRRAIEILEQEKKLMEKLPSLEMEEKTKRFRQACFKANYKKRRLVAEVEIEGDHDVGGIRMVKEPLPLTWHDQI